MRRKNAQQSAGNAAAFVLLIGLLIILYILFVPSSLRQQLLYGNQTNETPGITLRYENLTLLHESPRRLDFLRFNHYEHPISAFTLYKTTDSQIVERFNAFNIKNNVFEKKPKEVTFVVNNPENTDNVMLSFQTTKHVGMLSIILDGKVVYENEILVNSPEPIKLPRDLLKLSNTLRFEVSSVGWKFWLTNEYNLNDIKITAEVTDVSRQKSTNVFYMSDTEYANLERGVLKFDPDCNQVDVGVLDVSINGYDVFSGIPDCGMLNVKEFPPRYLKNGENFVIFKTNKGTYLIDLIKIDTYLKEFTYPIYYFDLTEGQFEDLQEGLVDVYVTLEFADTGDNRKAILVVNGKPKYVDSEGLLYTTKVAYDIIRPINNWLKIEPDGNVIDVVNLIVELRTR